MTVDADPEWAEGENTAEEMATSVMSRSRLIVCLGVRMDARGKRRTKVVHINHRTRFSFV